MGFHELSTGLRAVSEDRPEHSSFRDGDFYVQVVPILNPQRSALDPWEYSVMAYLQAWRGKSSSPMNFRAWWDALSEEQQDDVAHYFRHLIEFGPALGFPHSSKVGSSRCSHMCPASTISSHCRQLFLPVNDNYSFPCGRREAPLPDLFRNVPPCTVEATPRVQGGAFQIGR